MSGNIDIVTKLNWNSDEIIFISQASIQMDIQTESPLTVLRILCQDLRLYDAIYEPVVR